MNWEIRTDIYTHTHTHTHICILPCVKEIASGDLLKAQEAQLGAL